ncbi:MAG: hypothetical protein EA352_02000 [Gemmatimonadales bacterium]|nr:MAG: hypothetical protein EA352_02000 [Gemmatimonadales bacterium]
MRLLVTVFAVLTVFGAPAPVEPLSSCECATDLVWHAEEGRPVFVGIVTRVEFLDELEDGGPEPRIIVDIDVIRSWGEEIPSRITLHTFYNQWECEGYQFEEGKAYLLFAYVNPAPHQRRAHPEWPPAATFGTRYCGVHPLEGAGPEIERLNRAFPGQS